VKILAKSILGNTPSVFCMPASSVQQFQRKLSGQC